MRSLAILSILICSTAMGGGTCNQFFKANAVQQYVAPVQAYSRVYYSVGQQLQTQAVTTQAMKSDPLYDEFQEFLRFRAYKQGLRAGGGETQAVKQTLIVQKCAKCHGESLSSPKGETFIGGQNSSTIITEALRQIRDNKMPPEKPLTNEEKAAIMQELLESEK